MCGICGFITKKRIVLEQLKAMNDTMYHRGPDDSGEELCDAAGGFILGLAQRRLSILDLSPLGHQPMHSADGRLSIVFNGEIYNYQEIRQELCGYPFQSNCDTEVILAAFLKWGIACVEHFNGMFAIALYDRKKDELYLCRDRIGKKPLYYWREQDSVVFGSELKPVMKAMEYIGDGHKKINRQILGRFLYQKYIAAPETVFEHVFQVKPGEIVKLRVKRREKMDAVLSVDRWQYWDIKTVYHKEKGSGPAQLADALPEFRTLLERSVRLRMVADVPVGTFLSGGYDSTLVTAVAQSVSDLPVKTFCIGFDDPKYNEAEYANNVANYLGTDHTTLMIGEKDMLELVESIPCYYDEPFADSSQIATMLVSQLARKQVTVALSGDGGDEFFCGYNLYKRVAQAQKLDVLGAIAHWIGQVAGIEERYPFKLKVISKNREKDAKTQLISGNYLTVAEHMTDQEDALPCYYDWERSYEEENWQVRRMLLDMDTYLPGDILTKVDRASMKYSLETRCPLLDTAVMEFAFRIPHSLKYKNGVKKKILKELAYQYVPRELLDRPKTGFGVPLDQWLRGPLREMLLDHTQDHFLQRQGLFHPKYTSEFVRGYLESGDRGAGSGSNYSRTVWALLVFQQWYKTYMY
ncbi:MAG: asparagine synthase (glutamine-hydrolyzing) [Lachnospiraceae bacterium]|nr:asparagine synthase (glutamine-hydrolyzing) [Lachnospiraceae bacterium]